jgi:kinesin family protein 11
LPTRSNLEETLSTLDYALSCVQNIKNKPELNQPMSGMTRNSLLKEYVAEIKGQSLRCMLEEWNLFF